VGAEYRVRCTHVSFFERRGFEALENYWDMYPLYNIDMPNLPEGHLDELHIVMQGLRNYKRIATPISEERIRRARAGYYGMISELDEYAGEIWKVLEQTGQLESTIFIYTSDNGISMGEHGIFFHNNLYEESASIPLLIAGAGIPRGVVVDTPVAHVDAVATMLACAGAERPAALRGHSLLPLMEGRSGDHPGFAYSENHSEGNVTGSFMIRRGDWKYIHFTWDEDLLFNLAEDPGEFHNRIDDPSARTVREELKGLLHSQVDSEQVTLRAFRKQEGMLKDLARRMTEDELYKTFEFRLGQAQARALAAKYKGR
jgi:choline-sulfatase